MPLSRGDCRWLRLLRFVLVFARIDVFEVQAQLFLKVAVHNIEERVAFSFRHFECSRIKFAQRLPQFYGTFKPRLV